MFRNSIRWRLQLWLAFLLLCVLSGFGITVYELHRTNTFAQIDEELNRRIGALGTSVRRPPPPPEFGRRPPPEFGRPPPELALPEFGDEAKRPPRGDRRGPGRGGPPPEPPGSPRGPPPPMREVRLTAEAASLFDETDTNDYYYATWRRNGTVLKQSTNAPGSVPAPERPTDTLTHSRTRDTFREAYHYTELGDCILAGRNITGDLNAIHRLKLWLLAAGGGVLGLGLGGGWWLTTRAIRPVEEISMAASRISAGNLSERIAGATRTDELGRLARVLNATFARLEAAFLQQKNFTADASHELRTPLAIIISEAQTALARERSAGEYRETVEACLTEAQQMRRLTEALLQLARFDAGGEGIDREPIDLATVTKTCIDRINALPQDRNVQLKTELLPAKVFANTDYMIQVVTNLLANAISYNKPNGEVRVRTVGNDSEGILIVSDTGIGIGTEDLPHIFERFYRADKARGHVEGRMGLGLAIVKAIIDVHGGTIEVQSELNVGTTFTVKLPCFQNGHR